MAKKERKKSTFWADFKKFITKGNVIDLAVGVVIGGAFGKITTGLVNYIITPLTSLFLGNVDMTEKWKTVLVPEVLDEAGEVVTKEVAILWGTWIQTIIDFLIIAFTLFVVLRVIMKIKARMTEKEEKAKAEEAAKKAAEEKAAAEAAAAAAAEQAAAKAAREQAVYDSIAEQASVLREIRDLMKNK